MQQPCQAGAELPPLVVLAQLLPACKVRSASHALQITDTHAPVSHVRSFVRCLAYNAALVHHTAVIQFPLAPFRPGLIVRCRSGLGPPCSAPQPLPGLLPWDLQCQGVGGEGQWCVL
jgi:hypothetical protein